MGGVQTTLAALTQVKSGLERLDQESGRAISHYLSAIQKIDVALSSKCAKLQRMVDSAAEELRAASDEAERDAAEARLRLALREYERVKSAASAYRQQREAFLSALSHYRQIYGSRTAGQTSGIGACIKAVETYLNTGIAAGNSAPGSSCAIINVESRCTGCLQAMRGTFAESNWSRLDEGERKAALNEVAQQAGAALGVPIRGARFFNGPSEERGYYNGDGYLYFNRDTLTDPDNREDAVDTIFHEGRHAFQRAACQDPARYGITQETADVWRGELFHNIDGQRNFFAYQAQAIERDARQFAADVVRNGLYGGEM